jgi:PAS domain S-box-containing protein
MTTLERKLQKLGGDVHSPLEQLSVPMYVLDSRGTIVWVNAAAADIIPGATGRKFTDVLAPDEVHPGRRLFALRILGKAPFTDHTTTLRAPNGERHEVEISSAPLKRGHAIVGVFGVIRADRTPPPKPPASEAPQLTPRQHEVLVLLAQGLTTAQMADVMGLSPETVQNHVKALLRQLRVRSRLEAVLAGYRLGLLTSLDSTPRLTDFGQDTDAGSQRE